MELIHVFVALATLLCSLVAGLVLTFGIIVMPGIKNLGERGYLQSFKAMDRVIQDSQPIFVLVWLGSAVMLIASALLGIWKLEGFDQLFLIAACVLFILGVHVPTITINVPLNNRLQSHDLESMDKTELMALKADFDSQWLKWNTIRTIVAIVTTLMLLILLIRF